MNFEAMFCPRCAARPFSPCVLELPRVVYLCRQRRHMNALGGRKIDPFSGKPETLFEQQTELEVR